MIKIIWTCYLIVHLVLTQNVPNSSPLISTHVENFPVINEWSLSEYQICNSDLFYIRRILKHWFLFIWYSLACNDIFIARKRKFSDKIFFSKCEQIHKKLRICSYLPKQSLMESFIFGRCVFKELERERKTWAYPLNRDFTELHINYDL